jgi:hypothetical protein
VILFLALMPAYYTLDLCEDTKKRDRIFIKMCKAMKPIWNFQIKFFIFYRCCNFAAFEKRKYFERIETL